MRSPSKKRVKLTIVHVLPSYERDYSFVLKNPHMTLKSFADHAIKKVFKCGYEVEFEDLEVRVLTNQGKKLRTFYYDMEEEGNLNAMHIFGYFYGYKVEVCIVDYYNETKLLAESVVESLFYDDEFPPLGGGCNK